MLRNSRLYLVGGLLVLCLSFWPSGLFAQTGGVERITEFKSEIEVKADGTIEVEETIDYYFPSSRHGIYRDIPTHYRGEDGLLWEIPLAVYHVSSPTGAPSQYEKFTGPAGIQIKIGDPDRTISGQHRYVISYRADGALRYFDDHDELFWNVTGTEWTVPIEKSSATVKLPDGVSVTGVRCFTGPKNSQAEDCRKSYSGSTAEFSADGNLTAVVAWPTGLVARLLPNYLDPTLPIALSILPPLIAFVVMFRLWSKHGRDAPMNKTEVVQYDPPNDMPPAEMGTMLDGSTDTKDITASIVDLAVRGYLKIQECEKKGLLLSSKDHRLVLLKPEYRQDSALKSYEVRILSTLFGTGEKVRLSDLKDGYAFQHQLPKIKKELGSQVVLDGYYAKDPMAVRGRWLALPIGLAVISFFIGPPIMESAGLFSSTYQGVLVVSWVATLAIVAGFGWFMPKRTAKGAQAAHHAHGFKEYISRAEKYRIQWQEKENIFEKFLPYAMVFGVAEKWAKAFEGIDLKPPDWYEGSSLSSGAFNAIAFNSAFSSINSAISSTVTASPSSSGSGSGGGGGGGGGGSW